MSKLSVVIFGAGRIGQTIALLLAGTGDYRVRLVDSKAESLETLAGLSAASGQPIDGEVIDAHDPAAVRAACQGHWGVINALPYSLTAVVAQAAHAVGAHYFDLTEDVASTKIVSALASKNQPGALIPQCGLAPGAVSVIGGDLARRFDHLKSLHLRVGALPRYPTNGLNYALTWSPEGLINEYIQPCEAVVNGHKTSVPALAEREEFSVDGIHYEAFNTSGGLGTLADTLSGRVQSLNYRSIRYPGHRDAVRLLLQDLRLSERPDLLAEIFRHAIPSTQQDMVILFCNAIGERDGQLQQQTYTTTIHGAEVHGRFLTAIQLTTASAICAVVDLLATGALPDQGLVRQEDIPLDLFLSNRFGKVYAPQDASGALKAGASYRQAPMLADAAQ